MSVPNKRPFLGAFPLQGGGATLSLLAQISIIGLLCGCSHGKPDTKAKSMASPHSDAQVQVTPARANRGEVLSGRIRGEVLSGRIQDYQQKDGEPLRLQKAAPWIDKGTAFGTHENIEKAKTEFLTGPFLRLLIALGTDDPTSTMLKLAPYDAICQKEYLKCIALTSEEAGAAESIAEDTTEGVSATSIPIISASEGEMEQLLSFYAFKDTSSARLFLFDFDGILIWSSALLQSRQIDGLSSFMGIIARVRQYQPNPRPQTATADANQKTEECPVGQTVLNENLRLFAYNKKAQKTPFSKISPKGTPVLVNFWATWCEPCIREMPIVNKMEQRFGATVRFIGLIDERPLPEVIEKVTAQTRAASTRYQSAQYFEPDDHPISKRVFESRQIDILPRFAVFDKDGRLVNAVVGSLEIAGNEEKLAAALECAARIK